MSLRRYHGWLLLAHPQFEDQFAEWSNGVRRLAEKNPATYTSHPQTKRLATLQKLVFDVIPEDPTHRLWLQGNTLGSENRAWRRAKFHERYRLFFRFDSNSHIIIYAWVNDENSLRSRRSRSDSYAVFERMLRKGNPPSGWEELLEQSNALED